MEFFVSLQKFYDKKNDDGKLIANNKHHLNNSISGEEESKNSAIIRSIYITSNKY